MTYLSNLDTSRIYSTVVTATKRIGRDHAFEVRNITLSLGENSDFSYHAGQHVGVIVPGAYESSHEKHFRVYSIANSPATNEAKIQIELCVRRCSYIDETLGVELPGIASNYLCDLKIGDRVSITGPYGEMFRIPADPESTLLMIGSGTGIAPFRAFIQHISQKHRQWKGQLFLFYGAHSGTEMLYRNDRQNDLGNYYDEETFTAIQELSHLSQLPNENPGKEDSIAQHAQAIFKLVQHPKTHVYIAGLPATFSNFDKIMQEVAGSRESWREIRADLVEDRRWSELIYR